MDVWIFFLFVFNWVVGDILVYLSKVYKFFVEFKILIVLRYF